MPTFDYVAVDGGGRQSKGVLVAQDQQALQQHLRDAGSWLVSATERKAQGATARAGQGPRLKRRVLIELTMQLAILTRAGVPLSEALSQLHDDASDPALKQVLAALRFNINSGVEFSTALAQFPRTFPVLYVALVGAGEQSGNLPVVLRNLQAYLEWADGLANQARQATTYPMLVGIAIGLLVLVLFTFVVPQFTKLLLSLGVAMPMPTRVVMAISDFFKHWWWTLLLGGGLLVLGVRFATGRWERVALGVEKLRLGLPVFGPMRRKLALSRFSRNFALLFGSGLPVVECMAMLPALVGNRALALAVEQAGADIREGAGVAEAFAKHDIMEPLVLRMLAVGEATGEMTNALEQAALYYEEEIPRAIKRFFGLLEPALILFMVGIVGFVALAIMLPLMSLFSAVG